MVVIDAKLLNWVLIKSLITRHGCADAPRDESLTIFEDLDLNMTCVTSEG